MAKGSESPLPSLLLDEQASDIATPASDRWRIFAKSGGIYARNAAGTVVGPFAASTAAAEFPTGNAKVTAGETTTSTTFADLTTPGPAVTVTVGASGKVMLHVKSRLQNATAGMWSAVGVAVSGANTIAGFVILLAEQTTTQYLMEWGASTMLTGLAAGSTTFTMKYMVEGGTGNFTTRELTVAPVL